MEDSDSRNLKVLTLAAIFLCALIVRLSFAFYFQALYFGEMTFEFKDTPTYILPFTNWLDFGRYQGDLFLPDSQFFRPPVYPFFLGAFYIIFGENYATYVALFQCLLDSGSALVIYFIVRSSGLVAKAAYFPSVVYALYPFSILWTPILYTEILQIFLVLCSIFFLMETKRRGYISFFVSASFMALAVLTKQYLGALFLIHFFYIVQYAERESIFKLCCAGMIGCALILLPWGWRNYQVSGEVIILRGDTTGLRQNNVDFEAFERFANLFDQNITPALNDVVWHGTFPVVRHEDFIERHHQKIEEAVTLAHSCGDSFVQRRLWVSVSTAPYVGCAEEVAEKFLELTDLFWLEVPILEAMETRLDAVQKVFLPRKISGSYLEIHRGELLQGLLMFYRVLLIWLGLVAISLAILRRQKSSLLSVGAGACTLYVYFAVVIVHVEFRYVLMSDVLLILMLGLLRRSPCSKFENSRTSTVDLGS